MVSGFCYPGPDGRKTGPCILPSSGGFRPAGRKRPARRGSDHDSTEQVRGRAMKRRRAVETVAGARMRAQIHTGYDY
jgi:hypothetical protein